jgi:hypothetical protein
MSKKVFQDAKYPIHEIVIDDEDDGTGIRLLSLVDEPAIEMKGMAFSSRNNFEFKFKKEKDKQIIVGPALIPNKKILRKDEEGNYYYNIFKEGTIAKLVEKFNRKGDNRRINIDHQPKMVDAFIKENWIVEDTYYDKSRLYGFNVPKGTWMVAVKIEDENFWNKEVKEGGKFGFSIEGLLGEKPLEYSEVKSLVEWIDDMDDDDLIDIFSFEQEYKVITGNTRTRNNIIKSSNLWKFKYDDVKQELVLRFQDGEYYTYFSVPPDVFEAIRGGDGVCDTEGENEWGKWFVGKSPSVGAAIHEILIGGGFSYQKGGMI